MSGPLVGEKTGAYVESHLQVSAPEQHASLTGMEVICKNAAKDVNQPSRRRQRTSENRSSLTVCMMLYVRVIGRGCDWTGE